VVWPIQWRCARCWLIDSAPVCFRSCLRFSRELVPIHYTHGRAVRGQSDPLFFRTLVLKPLPRLPGVSQSAHPSADHLSSKRHHLVRGNFHLMSSWPLYTAERALQASPPDELKSRSLFCPGAAALVTIGAIMSITTSLKSHLIFRRGGQAFLSKTAWRTAVARFHYFQGRRHRCRLTPLWAQAALSAN